MLGFDLETIPVKGRCKHNLLFSHYFGETCPLEPRVLQIKRHDWSRTTSKSGEVDVFDPCARNFPPRIVQQQNRRFRVRDFSEMGFDVLLGLQDRWLAGVLGSQCSRALSMDRVFLSSKIRTHLLESADAS